MALGKLASGARRLAVAILEKESWGDCGMSTAVAIHKDKVPLCCRWSLICGMAGRGMVVNATRFLLDRGVNSST